MRKVLACISTTRGEERVVEHDDDGCRVQLREGIAQLEHDIRVRRHSVARPVHVCEVGDEDVTVLDLLQDRADDVWPPRDSGGRIVDSGWLDQVQLAADRLCRLLEGVTNKLAVGLLLAGLPCVKDVRPHGPSRAGRQPRVKARTVMRPLGSSGCAARRDAIGIRSRRALRCRWKRAELRRVVNRLNARRTAPQSLPGDFAKYEVPRSAASW